MNILVTGASGFIGKVLAENLKRNNHSVITIDKQKDSDLVCDISNYNLLRESVDSIENIDIIYHLAAQPFGKGGEEEPEIDVDWNAKGTLNVCRIASQLGVKRFIYTSTVAVYGNNNFAKETDVPNPLSNYAVSKLTGEFYVKKFSNEFGFDYNILRLWNTYGHGQDIKNEYKGVVFAFANQILRDNYIKVTGSLERYRDIIYVDDVVSALIHCLNLSGSDTFNVCTSKKITIKELIETLILANGEQVQNYRIENIGGSSSDQFGCVGDNEKLKKTGWLPKIDNSTGIKLFLNYLKENVS
jgi:UDP-glucose 4-epimerase